MTIDNCMLPWQFSYPLSLKANWITLASKPVIKPASASRNSQEMHSVAKRVSALFYKPLLKESTLYNTTPQIKAYSTR